MSDGKLPYLLDELKMMARMGKGPSSLRLINGQANDSVLGGNTIQVLGNVITPVGADGYLPPSETLALQMNSSANQDSAASSGVRKIRFSYVTETFEMKDVILDTDGTSMVALPADCMHVNEAQSHDAGSNGNFEGQMKVTETVSGDEKFRVSNIESSRLSYICPKDHVAFLLDFEVAGGSDVTLSTDTDGVYADVHVYSPLTGTPDSYNQGPTISRVMSGLHGKDGMDVAEGYELMLNEGDCLTSRIHNRQAGTIRYYAYWRILQIPTSLL